MNSSSLAIVVLCALFVAYFWVISWMKRKKSLEAERQLPPGPTRLPVIGNLHQIRNPLHKSLQRLAKEHGDLMFLQLGSVPALVISSADVAREIFKTHDPVFSGRPALYVAKKLSYNCSNISFAPYGERWRQVRKIAILELLSAKRVQSFQAAREEEVALVLDSIASSSGPVNLSDLMLLLSNNFLCRVAFGKKYCSGYTSSSSSRIKDMLHEAQELLGSVCVADFFPSMVWLNKFNSLDARLQKIFRDFDEFYDKVIEEHLDPNRPKPDHEDLVNVLLRVQKYPSPEFGLTEESIKGLLTDVFVAGTDTSAATLVWTMAELIRNPLVMKKAEEEVRKIAQGKTKVEESDVSKLVYLKSVVKEALRLHPPAPLLVPRETIEDCEIRGHKIPAKTRVFINATLILQDINSWENPLEFQPERFLDSSIDFNGQNFEFIPFGVGRRGCPGANFAIQLVELALANLLHSFQWKLPPGVSAEDLDMEAALGLTMQKKSPLFLVANPAHSSLGSPLNYHI